MRQSMDYDRAQTHLVDSIPRDGRKASMGMEVAHVIHTVQEQFEEMDATIFTKLECIFVLLLFVVFIIIVLASLVCIKASATTVAKCKYTLGAKDSFEITLQLTIRADGLVWRSHSAAQ